MTSASNCINVTYLLHGNPNDLRHLLSYPITTVPLSLAHIDGTPLKTDKATLTKALEIRQPVVFVDTNLPSIKATISDGGILLYECDATQQIHVGSHGQGSVGESVFPSRRVYYSTNTSLHPSRMLIGNWWLQYSECIHHNRPRPSPATEWNGVPHKRGIQGRVCQFPHDPMEEGPLWTSNWQQNDLHLTWWKNA